MIQQEYRREMDRIELTEGQRARLVRAMVQRNPRPRRFPARALAAAALICAALTTSALALSPALRDSLARALGSFAPYSQAVEGAAAVDQNVEVRVVSAVTDRYRVKLYVEVTDRTGERIVDDQTSLRAWVVRETGEDGLRGRCVEYDPETCTALFELDGNQEGASGTAEELTMRITRIQPRQYHEYTTDTGAMAQALSPDYARAMKLGTGETVLAPGQTPLEIPGLERAALSSMGFFPDGSFHTLFRLPEGAVLEQGGVDGSYMYPELLVNGEPPGGAFETYCFELDGVPYFGAAFSPVAPGDLAGISFAGVGGEVVLEPGIEGVWEIPFQVENMEALELELTGTAGGASRPARLVLTPLGATITGGYDSGYWGGKSFAVVYEDGSRMDQTAVEAGRMSPEGTCVLGNWTFGELVDLGKAATLELGDWYIPLAGPDAGEARPK